MKTFAEPATQIRLYQSGAIKTLGQTIRVKELPVDDDTNDVRVSAGPYRIVMHCQSGARERAIDRSISVQ